MKCAVSDETRRKAIGCGKDFYCLRDDGASVCPVQGFFHGEILLVECLDEAYCSYQLPFRQRRICACPVRKELYHRYKV